MAAEMAESEVMRAEMAASPGAEDKSAEDKSAGPEEKSAPTPPPPPPGYDGRTGEAELAAVSQIAPAEAETPSGKGAEDENFPVGSFLIPAALRPHVANYYAFARAIDDIADNPDLSADERILRLNAFEAAVRGYQGYEAGYEKAHACRRSLEACGVAVAHAADLCTAFRLDAKKLRYEEWDELLYYCRYSANPVGRFLVDLHGEDLSAYRPSDALCTALQVLNHLQDCGEDYNNLDRVYIIQSWMREEGANTEELTAGPMTPAMRRVVDRMLDRTDELIEEARDLPAMVYHRRFAMECATIVRLAERLSVLLRKNDPLSERVALTKFDFARAGLFGVLWGLAGRRPPKPELRS